MNESLERIKSTIYLKNNLIITAFKSENESQEYQAARFKLNENRIVYREGKITPKKIGQFVTFWNRNPDGLTEALHESDDFDFYIITVINNERTGQFIFPKSALIKYGIISTTKKAGKRGFRIYPCWDKPISVQAVKTQSWQLGYFCEFTVLNPYPCLKKLIG